MLALLAAAALLPACHDDGDDNGSSGDGGQGPRGDTVSLRTSLSGTQEVPQVITFGEGNATLFIPANRDRVDVALDFTSLTGVTMAHIHVGPPGVDGPIIFDLATDPFVSPLQRTLTAGDLQPRPGVATFQDALAAIEGGNAYVNVHTLAQPDGEIRGQIGPAGFRAAMNGANVLPATTSPGSGVATAALNADQSQLTFQLSVAGMTGPPTAARIHVASPGLNGPPIFDLSTTMFDSTLNGAVSAVDLRPQPLVDVLTFPDAVDALLSGNAYVLITSAAFPAGEIRGQLVRGSVQVTPAPTVPPSSTMANDFPPPPPSFTPTPVVVVIPPVVDPLEMPVTTVVPPVSSPSVPSPSNVTVPPTTPAVPPGTTQTVSPFSSPSVPTGSNLITPATTPIFGPAMNTMLPPVSSPSVAPSSNLITPATTPIFGPAINPFVPVTPTPFPPATTSGTTTTP